MNNKSAKWLYFFLLLQPIIDLFTSLMTRFINIPITIGMLTRGIFLLVIVLYTIINKKRDKKAIIYLSILCVFFLLYFITKTDIFNLNFLITEIKYLFKYMYFPIVAVCMINIYDTLKLEKEKIFNIFIINLIVYSLLILVPEITGTSFASYLDANKGTVGWFYSANEIGAILIALFPNMYYMIFKRNSFLKIIVLFTIVILAMILLGTKTAFLGMLITEVIYLMYFVFNSKKNRGYGLKISAILIIFSFVVIPNIPAVKNMQRVISESNKVEEDTLEDYDYGVFQNPELQKIIRVAFSGRDKFFFRTLNIYEEASLDDKILGLGFVNRNQIDNKHVEKLIEIDPLDIYFHYGIVGFILYFTPLIYIVFKGIKYTIQNKFKLSYFKLTNIFTIGIITVVSMMAGHIYGAPSVSIYIVLSIAMFNSALKKEETLEIKHNGDKKKITILALHLNYGGVEQYISSLCKMLEDNYEIEIISTYKIGDKPAFPFSDKINIKYLINEKPNREELKAAIKSKNIFKIIKEGFISIKILYLKKHRNINAIRNIYSDYIITTRDFHNRLVGYYAYHDIIKIATEHNYHNDDKKYINKVINSIYGFDYFVLVTENLQNFYKNKIKKTKCLYIPNVINSLPNKSSKLKNNNIINVGRLEKEKAQEELIDIVKELKKEIKDIKLYLIGDGSLKSQINKKINENDLEDNIILTGFISKSEIEKYMIDSKLFVMTSHTESFGLVLIEAMSYKVPCIAYDSADGAKVLLKDENGILIKNRDQKEMINKIKELLNDNKKIKKYSEKGYESCKRYLIDNVREEWLKILK